MRVAQGPGRYWAQWTSEAFSRLDRGSLVAVLPIGAIEQHGPHLPMCVDTATVDGLVAATLPRLPAASQVLVLPTCPVGKSNEHAAYPGTLSFSAQTLLAIWTELGEGVARAGVRKLVLFNGHGGQEGLSQAVARDLRVRHGMLVACVDWYGLGLPPGLIGDDELRFGIHAGELETSVMLHLHPELVDASRARNFDSEERRLRADRETLSFLGPGVSIAWQTQDLQRQGACGNAAAGTAAKGRLAVDHVAERFARFLTEFEALPLSVLESAGAWG